LSIFKSNNSTNIRYNLFIEKPWAGGRLQVVFTGPGQHGRGPYALSSAGGNRGNKVFQGDKKTLQDVDLQGFLNKSCGAGGI